MYNIFPSLRLIHTGVVMENLVTKIAAQLSTPPYATMIQDCSDSNNGIEITSNCAIAVGVNEPQRSSQWRYSTQIVPLAPNTVHFVCSILFSDNLNTTM